MYPSNKTHSPYFISQLTHYRPLFAELQTVVPIHKITFDDRQKTKWRLEFIISKPTFNLMLPMLGQSPDTTYHVTELHAKQLIHNDRLIMIDVCNVIDDNKPKFNIRLTYIVDTKQPDRSSIFVTNRFLIKTLPAIPGIMNWMCFANSIKTNTKLKNIFKHLFYYATLPDDV